MKTFYKALITFVGLVFINTLSYGQTILISSGGTQTTCTGNFFDSGDSGGNYGLNENYTQTICGDGSNTPLYMTFNSFQLESSWDFLYIYDGTSTSSPLIGTYSGTTSPGTVVASSGCLTYQFTSDGSVALPGWSATINCGTPPPPPPSASTTCAGAGGACISSVITFPAGTTGGAAETGPNYGCLSTVPNPGWYYLQIGASGNIDINISNSSGIDVDAAIWGPFSSPSTSCTDPALTSNAPVACDYSTAANFNLAIPSAIVGEYYLILITNYTGSATDVSFSQSGGTGATTCNALCDLTAISGTASACDPATTTYSVSGTITVNNPPTSGVLTISDNTGASQVLNPPFASSIPFSVTGITADGASHTVTATFSGTSGCTQSFSYTAPAACCLPVTISGNNLCAGGSSTLSVAGTFSSYTWADVSSGTPVPIGSGATVTVTNPGIYGVQVVNALGCTSQDTITISVAAPLTPVITGNLSICSGNSTTLDAGVGFTSYSWSDGITVVGTAQTLVVSTAGSFTLTVTDANGCSGTASADVVANTAPTPTITGNLSVCSGNSTTLDAGSGFTSYSWSDGTTVVGTTQTQDVSAAGTYTVTVTDANGCAGTANATVTITTTIVNIIGDTTVCTIGTTTTTLDAGLFATYSWSDGTTVIGTTQTISVGAGTYIVTVTDNSGCSGTDTVTVTATTLTVNITGQTVICAGTTTTLFATQGFTSYSWTELLPPPSPPPFPIGNLDSLENASQGAYQVDVIDANGCMGSATVVVIENDTIPITISGNTGVCPGGTGTLLDVGPGYTNQVWATIVGQTITPVAFGQTYTAITPGLYGAQVQVSTGCIGVDTITIVSLPALTPTITGNLTYCTGTTTLSTQIFATYDWSDGTSSIGTSQSVNVASGTYTVTVTDANGCSGTSQPAIVTQSTQINFTITGNNTICSGDTALLDAGTGFTSYQWGTLDPLGNIVPLVGETNQTFSAISQGIYGVQVTSSGCTGLDSIIVTLNQSPTSSITGSATFCVGNTTTLDAGVGFTSYSWSDGTTVVGTSQTLIVSTAGIYTVTVTDANGCSGTSTALNVTQSTTITPTVTGPLQYCQGDSTTLDAGSGFTGYSWTDVNTSQIIGTNQTITVTSGTYQVSVNQGACSGASSNQIVTEVIPPTVTATAQGASTVCQGSSVTLVATGGGVSTFTWFPGGQTGSTIQVTLSDTFVAYGEIIPGCGDTSTAVIVTVNQNPTITITPDGPTQFCNGSVGLSAGGADTYVWAPSGSTQSVITVSQSGSITLQGTDANGCQGSASIDITSGSTLVVNVTSSTGTNVVCSGQPVTLDGTTVGATTYSWAPNGETTPTITAASSGTYTLTVTDGTSCQSISSPFDLTLGNTPSPIVSSSTNSGTLCVSGGPIILSASNGPFVTYQWSTSSTDIGSSITVNQPGTYTVTVTNTEGCEATSAPFYVVLSPEDLVIVADGPTVFCEGTQSFNQVGLDATAGFDNYIWTSGSTTEDIVTNIPGTYYVTGYNYCHPYPNGGLQSNSISITIIPHIEAYIVVINDTLKAMPPANSYQWYKDGQVIPGAFNQYYVVDSATQTANYFVVTTDSSGCGGDTSLTYNFIRKPNTIGFEELDGVTEMNIFPNPTNEMLNVEAIFTGNSNIQVSLTDVVGRNVVEEFSFGGNGYVSRQINLSSLTKGVYFVTIRSNSTAITKRIFKD